MHPIMKKVLQKEIKMAEKAEKQKIYLEKKGREDKVAEERGDWDRLHPAMKKYIQANQEKQEKVEGALVDYKIKEQIIKKRKEVKDEEIKVDRQKMMEKMADRMRWHQEKRKWYVIENAEHKVKENTKHLPGIV